jgi:hypothetical protein
MDSQNLNDDSLLQKAEKVLQKSKLNKLQEQPRLSYFPKPENLSLLERADLALKNAD